MALEAGVAKKLKAGQVRGPLGSVEIGIAVWMAAF